MNNFIMWVIVASIGLVLLAMLVGFLDRPAKRPERKGSSYQQRELVQAETSQVSQQYSTLQMLQSSGALPYQRAYSLLSKSERVLYEALQKAAGKNMRIFAKVRLLDLLWLPDGTAYKYRNPTMSKHVDFVLCHEQTLAPALVVESDGSSHGRTDSRERDAVKDFVLHAAGLPILRIPIAQTYSVEEIAYLIRGALATGSATNIGDKPSSYTAR